jgi:hypothetical protein
LLLPQKIIAGIALKLLILCLIRYKIRPEYFKNTLFKRDFGRQKVYNSGGEEFPVDN